MANELSLQINGESRLATRETGWLRATLLLDDIPYWPAGESEGFDWTWIDFLDFLARHWSALMLEEGSPLPLGSLCAPDRLWHLAETRWEDLPESQIEQEELQLLSFCERHNLAMAFPGAAVPMLFWLRSGETLWLGEESTPAQRRAFHPLAQQLETIGNQLAAAFRHSSNAHVLAVRQQWQQRQQRLRSDYLSYRTGLNSERLQQLRQHITLDEPAKIPERSNQEPAWLAAARMSRHQLPTQQLATVIQRLQQASPATHEVFPSLTKAALACLQSVQAAHQPAWMQGQILARWLRETLQLTAEQRADPETLLLKAGVQIEDYRLETAHIDAIACWGDIQPLILLNTHPQARSHQHGRRASLAHELCHLLVDRQHALPIAEVLGGEVDNEAEKRANAFAAEFLMPQSWATQCLQQSRQVSLVVQALSHSHAVSPQLIARQLLNALDPVEDDRHIQLRQYL